MREKFSVKPHESIEHHKNTKNSFGNISQLPGAIINNLKKWKSKKYLLKKIGSGNIPNKDEYKFIISLPESDLQKFCQNIKRGAEAHCFTIGMLKFSHNMTKNHPDIQHVLSIIESINSVLKYISDNSTVKVKPVEIDYLFKNEK